MKQKDLKTMVKNGIAQDITNWQSEDIEKLGYLSKIDITTGTYGMNGGLFKDRQGNLYVITSRSTNLFMLA